MLRLSHKLGPWVAGLLAAILVIGCGGGTDTASNGVGVGGTGAAATGPVTGYGSLIVSNVRFDVEDASFASDEGSSLSLTSTQRVRPVGLGAIVDIRAGVIGRNTDNDEVATATVVTVISAIRGPVTAKPSSTSLTVLGQTVNVNSATQYDQDNGLAGVSVGNNVEVYGYQDANGAYLATRIEVLSTTPTSYKLRGKVSSVTSSSVFTMGGITLSIPGSGSTLIRMPSGGLHAGDLVRVQFGPSAISANNFLVTALSAIDVSAVKATSTHMDGIVSNFTSVSQTFKVDGVTVSVPSTATVTGTLANNKRASVDGTVTNGVLVASSVQVRDDSGSDVTFKLIGLVSNLNTGAQTFSLKGLTVSYGSATFEGGTASNLGNNRMVEVEGRLTTTGFIATGIRLR